jgi:hypothetical protein
MSTTVLLKTHFFDSSIEAGWRRLRREAPSDWRVLIALNRGEGEEQVPDTAARLPAAAFFVFNNRSLLSLPYPAKCNPVAWRLNPGNADLIPLLFMTRYPDCEHVWGIEYDVHYEGAWSRLFDHFKRSKADLLATTLRFRRDVPGKTAMRPPLKSPSFQEYPEDDRLYVFLPFYRLSRSGATAIDRAYRAGAAGHYELTWATILRCANLGLEDIGGNGAWVRPENINRFYFNSPMSYSMAPGTFVFRPPFHKIPGRPNTLWHPLKPMDAQNWWPVRLRSDNRIKNVIEAAKPYANRVLIEGWFTTRWNPLR